MALCLSLISFRSRISLVSCSAFHGALPVPYHQRKRAPRSLRLDVLAPALALFLELLLLSGCVHTAPFKDSNARVIPESIATMEDIVIGEVIHRIWFRSYLSSLTQTKRRTRGYTRLEGKDHDEWMRTSRTASLRIFPDEYQLLQCGPIALVFDCLNLN